MGGANCGWGSAGSGCNSLPLLTDGTSSKRIDNDVIVYIFLDLSSAGSKICCVTIFKWRS